MSFSDKIIIEAWKRTHNKCECQSINHGHIFGLCPNELIWDHHGINGFGGWDVQAITKNGNNSLENCEIQCFECSSKNIALANIHFPDNNQFPVGV